MNICIFLHYLKMMVQKIKISLIPLFLTLILSSLSGQELAVQPSSENMLDLNQADTVRVLLFDSEPPESIKIQAVDSPITIFFNNDSLRIEPESGLLTLTRNKDQLEIFWNGETYHTENFILKNSVGVSRVISEPFGYRLYRGDIHFTVQPGRKNIQTINHVKLEDYIASVIGSEMNFRSVEALKTQAVVSRTYALWSMHESPFSDFDLKDFESNQMYIGDIPSKPWYMNAALATHGEILTWSDKLILSVFSSTCGGTTSNNEDVWSGKPLPYLRSVNDGNVCSISPHFRWEFSMSHNQLDNILEERYRFRKDRSEIIKDTFGRVSTINFYNSNNRSLSFTGNEFRLLINRHFGPLSLKSTRFEWDDSDDITISGAGLGHGVGLCQWGAKGLANDGWNYQQILSFYFSGTKVVDLHKIDSKQIALHK